MHVCVCVCVRAHTIDSLMQLHMLLIESPLSLRFRVYPTASFHHCRSSGGTFDDSHKLLCHFSEWMPSLNSSEDIANSYCSQANSLKQYTAVCRLMMFI
jgi:hypothetical protein